jgi:hypothetical protein
MKDRLAFLSFFNKVISNLESENFKVSICSEGGEDGEDLGTFYDPKMDTVIWRYRIDNNDEITEDTKPFHEYFLKELEQRTNHLDSAISSELVNSNSFEEKAFRANQWINILNRLIETSNNYDIPETNKEFHKLTLNALNFLIRSIEDDLTLRQVDTRFKSKNYEKDKSAKKLPSCIWFARDLERLSQLYDCLYVDKMIIVDESNQKSSFVNFFSNEPLRMVNISIRWKSKRACKYFIDQISELKLNDSSNKDKPIVKFFPPKWEIIRSCFFDSKGHSFKFLNNETKEPPEKIKNKINFCLKILTKSSSTS